MRFREFESRVEELPAFNINDVRKFDPGFHRPQLSYWQDKGYIKPLAGGYYILADQPVNEAFLFMMANKLYAPSYVSLESALAYYQAIPESVLGVTSISSRKTQQFESEWGSFSYRSVKPTYMFGYQVVEVNPKRKFAIARLEKAVLDYLYLHPELQAPADFEGLRWNRAELQGLEESSLFGTYLEIFDKKALAKRAAHLMRYLDA
jgi:predicted transcriptional regulator of viral defense system